MATTIPAHTVPAAFRGRAVYDCARGFLHSGRQGGQILAAQRMAELMVDKLNLPVQSLVYALIRTPLNEDYPYLADALHKRLRQIQAPPLDGLQLFYKTWNEEHSCERDCPLGEALHEFACQMHGEELMLNDIEGIIS